MAKEEWGAKRVCREEGCGARFYDLMRDPVICPKCGTELVVEVPNTPQDKEFEPAADEARSAKKVPGAIEDDDDILTEDGDGVEIDDDVLDESDDDTVPLDDIANVATDDES
ncbi:MAG: FYDLN acid domain-containing protein [Rhodobacteraceae bacterium]|nr:FYDLN acid domain-containing protein [Paracoccaceae bacterium]